jgi:hypothetical protein
MFGREKDIFAFAVLACGKKMINWIYKADKAAAGYLYTRRGSEQVDKKFIKQLFLWKVQGRGPPLATRHN